MTSTMVDADACGCSRGHSGWYDPGTMSTEDPPPKRLPIARVLAGVVAVIALAALGRQFGVFLDRFVEWVDGLGALGPIVFMLGYVAATVAFIPGSVLTIAAGARSSGSGRGSSTSWPAPRPAPRSPFCSPASSPARRLPSEWPAIRGSPRFDRAVGREGFKNRSFCSASRRSSRSTC